MRQIKNVAANFALVLVAVTLTLAAAEGILRVFQIPLPNHVDGDREYFTRFDPILGWRALPDVEALHTQHGFSAKVRQNRLGLRAASTIGPERTDERHRVLVLGDSYVWGYGTDQQDLFTEPAVHGHPDVELINFGVSGYGTDQELLWYRDLGRQFDVDQVILAFTPYNDVSNNLSAAAYGYDKPHFVLSDSELHHNADHLKEREKIETWKSFLSATRVGSLIHSAILGIRYITVKTLFPAQGVADAADQIRNSNDVSDRDLEGLELTIALIEALRDDVQSAGANLIVTFIPYKPHILTNTNRNHPFVPILMERLDALGIDGFDPYDVFLKAAEEGAVLYNARDNHFNASGHALFAKVLIEQLEID